MIVVDANVMVMALSSPTSQGNAARTALTADDTWAAPAHMPLEVLRTLRKAVLSNHLSTDDADAAFRALTAMHIDYVGIDTTLLQTVWAMRHNLSIYDAAYLAVAAMYDAPLVTFDARLIKAAEQTVPNVQERSPDRCPLPDIDSGDSAEVQVRRRQSVSTYSTVTDLARLRGLSIS